MAKKRKDGTPMVKWGKNGRSNSVIDKDQFERLCVISPTILEVCSVFKVQDDTLNSWCKRTYGVTFSEILPRLGATGKMSLRRKIWNNALSENQEYAIKMLANKHLNMNVTQTSHMSFAEKNAQTGTKEVTVTWVTGEESKDFFDK